MKMDARKQKVLLAIISDYISTAEPVGSRTIARKYDMGVSPATIRNEMSDLEEMGYIEQPHTSAGRVPSQQGYRYYVDFLMKRKGLTSREEEMIRRGYEQKIRDVGQVITRTGMMLSQMTNHAAVIMSPRVETSAFKHIQLVLLNTGQAVVIVVMSTGALKSSRIDVPEGVTQDDLNTISSVLNAKFQGLTMDRIRVTLLREVYLELSKHRNIVDLAVHLIQNGLATGGEEKIYLGGMLNILNQPEFHNIEKVKTLLSLLEQEEMLHNLMETNTSEEGVTVRIGSEMKRDEVRECSMVVANYHIDGVPAGSMGVIGPTRMDYAWVISVVDYMTQQLSDTMEKLVKGWR